MVCDRLNQASPGKIEFLEQLEGAGGIFQAVLPAVHLIPGGLEAGELLQVAAGCLYIIPKLRLRGFLL